MLLVIVLFGCFVFVGDLVVAFVDVLFLLSRVCPLCLLSICYVLYFGFAFECWRWILELLCLCCVLSVCFDLCSCCVSAVCSRVLLWCSLVCLLFSQCRCFCFRWFCWEGDVIIIVECWFLFALIVGRLSVGIRLLCSHSSSECISGAFISL